MSTLSQQASLSETELWTHFRGGDAAAFDALVLRHYRMLFNYGTKFSDDEEFLKDCLQDLFVDLWRTRERLSDTVFVRQYLLKALRNRIISEKKRPLARLIERSWRADDYAFTMDFSIEDELIRTQTNQEQLQRLNLALTQLSPRQREAIYLKFYQNLSVTELTAVMEINEQSVRNLLHTAVHALRERMLLALLLGLFESALLPV